MLTKPSDLPEYPELPAGYSHWEYKGLGYRSAEPCCYCIIFPDETTRRWSVSFDYAPGGSIFMHYAIAVPVNKPAEPETPCLEMQLDHAKKELAAAQEQFAVLEAMRRSKKGSGARAYVVREFKARVAAAISGS